MVTRCFARLRPTLLPVVLIAVGLVLVACGWNEATQRFTANGQDVDPAVVGGAVGTAVNVVAPGLGTVVGGAILAGYSIAASIYGAIRNKQRRTAAPYVTAAHDIILSLQQFRLKHPDAWPTIAAWFKREKKDGGQSAEAEAVVAKVLGEPGSPA